MHRASILMVRCPNTGHELSTGIEMDAGTFVQLPECGHDHILSTREAWLGEPAPSVPEFTWLFINNRNLPND